MVVLCEVYMWKDVFIIALNVIVIVIGLLYIDLIIVEIKNRK